MSTLKFKRGPKANLPSSAQEGEPLFCTDTGELFIGKGSSQPLVEIGRKEFLSLNDFPKIVPEADDTASIQRLFNAASGKEAYIPKDGTYEISSKLILPKNTSLKMSKGVVLKAISSLDYVLSWDLGGEYWNLNEYIDGGQIDGNDIASCLFVKNFHPVEVKNMVLNNGKVYGLKVADVAGSYELKCSNLYFKCKNETNLTNTAIEMNAGDSHFEDIIIVNYSKGVITNSGGNRFNRVHFWATQTNRLPNTIAFINNVGEQLYNSCYADTAKIGWELHAKARLVGCTGYNNPTFGLTDLTYIWRAVTNVDLVIDSCLFTGTTANNKFMSGAKNSYVYISNCLFSGLADVDNSHTYDDVMSPSITSQYYNFARITVPKSRGANTFQVTFQIKINNAAGDATRTPKSCELAIDIKGADNNTYTIAVANADNYEVSKNVTIITSTDTDNLYFDFYYYSSYYENLLIKVKNIVGRIDSWNGSLTVATPRYYIMNKTVQILSNGSLSSSAPIGTTIPITGKPNFSVDQIKIGGWYIWDDGAGNLRKKNSPPSSLTDGTIIA